MRFFLFIFISTVLGFADTVPPALVWTADPTSIGSGSVSPTATGMTFDVSCVTSTPECGIEAVAFRDFTVTAPGEFIVSGSASFEMFAQASCLPSTCTTSAFVSGHFSVDNDLNPGIELGNSGSASTPLLVIDVVLSDSKSAIITLPVGDYVFTEDVGANTLGSGDALGAFSGDFSLVPTPEPRYSFLVLAVAFILLACFRGKLRPTHLADYHSGNQQTTP
jgi:hypothetical protein